MGKIFAGSEFIEALVEDKLKEPIVLFGMVKPDGNSRSAILFTEGSCSTWVSIAEGLIEEVEHLSMMKCRDHEHPFVRIVLKEPAPGDVGAVTFSQLLRAKQSMQRTAVGLSGSGPIALPPPGSTLGGSGAGIRPLEASQPGGGSGGTSDCPCVEWMMNCTVVWVNVGSRGRTIWLPTLECQPGMVCVRRDCREQ